MPASASTRRRLAATAISIGVALTIATPVARASSETLGTFAPATVGDLAIAPDGTVFGSDCFNARIYRFDPDGAIHVVAGSGPGGFDNGYAGDGGPALDARFGCIYGIRFDGSGRLVLADHLNDVIRRIDRNGIVSTIAGVGPMYPSSQGAWYPNVKHAGDGGPATSAVLDAPVGVSFDPAGDLLVGDRDHDAIRLIDPAGTIHTVAGTGQRGFGGDGGPATSAKLDRPLETVSVGSTLLIADENNSRIRRVSSDGDISTFAGTGVVGCGGNGLPATAAPLANPNTIDAAPNGSVYVSEGDCHEVRVITADGRIHAFAGTGVDGCSGFNGGPALAAQFSDPVSVRVGAHGDVLIADDTCRVVVRVDSAGRTHLVGDLSTLD